MSGASTATAVKLYVESLGLSLVAYRDGAPTNDAGQVTAAYPHVVVQEGIAYDHQLHGDYGDPNAAEAVTELVQVDLYQLARKLVGASSQDVESYTLPDALRRALHGAKLGELGSGSTSRRVYGVTLRDGRRWPIADNVVRHTFTIAVERQT
jgi:hypothetical protein